MNKIIDIESEETEQIKQPGTIIENASKPIKFSKTYLKWSIANLILSLFTIISLGFNVIAFKYSFKTHSDNKTGDFIEAKRHSKLAKKFNVITTVFICVVYLMVILAVLFVVHFNYASKNQTFPSTAVLSSPAPNKIILNVTQAIVGSWRLSSSDQQFNAYLTEIGVNFVIRVLALNLIPTLEFIHLENDLWKLNGKTSIRSKSDTFKFDEEFLEETFDIMSKSTFRLKDNKFIKTQRHIDSDVVFSEISFEVTSDNRLLCISKANKIKSVSYFDRI